MLELESKGFIYRHKEGKFVYPAVEKSFFVQKNERRNVKDAVTKQVSKDDIAFEFLQYWNDIYRTDFSMSEQKKTLILDRLDEFTIKELKEGAVKRLKSVETDPFWQDKSKELIRSNPVSYLKSKDTVESFLNKFDVDSVNIKPFNYN
jgi:hypothetical protein